MSSLKKLLFLSALIVFFHSGSTIGQMPTCYLPQHEHAGGPLNFVENKSQWHENVLFKTNFEGNNTLFIERQGYTVLTTNIDDLNSISQLHVSPLNDSVHRIVHSHAYKVKFLGSSPSNGIGIAPRKAYHNYFLGNDYSKWASKVKQFGKVLQEDIYPGINLETYSQNGHLKYDLIVAPQADVSKVKIQYTGADKLELIEGNLSISTSLGIITEMTPVAWQFIDGQRVQVPCYFSLTENILSYSFPNSYNKNHELVIDPTIIASTLTGTTGASTSLGNFGHSATFDNAGNIYAAGISFVNTFPTSVGAFQETYGGGGQDIALIKYNPDGSDMIYATYIGGNQSEWPHSIITDFNQQVYIYGSTQSADYPVTSNGFQQNFGGDRDIVVTILTQDGSALVGSSFFGGSGADGLNQINGHITWSYGDDYRGEIVIDGQNNVYIIGSTQSANFPITANAYDNSFNSNGFPAQDAVVLKANSDLSFLHWATFLGGDDLDSGNGIRVDDELNVYVTGTAGGANFPTTPGSIQPTWPGGEESGYLVKLSANGATLLASTFVGSSGSDNSYFVDIDEDDQIHVYGKTTGNISVTPSGTYSGVSGSNQFLMAFDNTLSSTVYQTIIGNGPNTIGPNGKFNYDFVPVAFMVDKCNGIYFSGYYAGPGLPTTSDAIPGQTPSPEAFYLGVLTPNAESLEFATYYGRSDHVDGGTSRFDKGGVIYQGVCSCTWPNNPTPLNTLPNAWATTQQTGCDIGVFKIDLEIDAINANGIALPSTAGCAPYEVDFVFTGTNAVNFEWSVDTGIISNLPNHTYTFTEPGTYDVQLAVDNPSACNPRDTFHIEIVVLDGNTTSTFSTICLDGQVFLDAGTPGAVYTWQDGSTAAGYVAQTTGIYWVDIDLGACLRRDSFMVLPSTEVDLDLGPDISFCDTIPSFTIDATNSGLVSYEWQNGNTDPILEVTSSGFYSMSAIDTSGCTIEDDILVQFLITPEPDLGVIDTLCDETTLTLSPDLQNSLPIWQDGSSNPTFEVTGPGEYWLELNNGGCRVSDTIYVEYFPPIEINITATHNDCAGDCNGTAISTPSGGIGFGYTFIWNNGAVSSSLADLCPGIYTVTVTDSRGCTAVESIEISAPSPLEMTIAFENVECAGDMDGEIQVSNVTGGQAPYSFSFDGSDFSEVNSIGSLSGGMYEVIVIDNNGCFISESVAIDEPDDFQISAGQDQVIDLGEIIHLNGQIVPYSDQLISWSPPDFLNCLDCLSPTLCPTQTTLYLLTVSPPNSACFLQDSVLITVNKNRRIYIPNAFSPNDDGANDFFTVFSGIGVQEISELKIFDRWGELVFENYNFQPNDEREGWNGHFKGKLLNPAVFVYYAKVLFKDGVSIGYEGDLNLIK